MTIRRITGSTNGATPLTDGLTRGVFIAAAQAVLAFVGMEVTGWLTADNLVTLLPATTLIGVIAWGIWDAIDRRLLSRQQNAFDAAHNLEDRMERGDGITPGDGL